LSTERRSYPCLFECRDGSTYLVVEDPLQLSEDYLDARSVVLRLDGEITNFYDTSRVFHTLTMEALAFMDCAKRNY
jgi:hypothetical protein